MRIITEYPLWFLIFCALIGAGISALLYYHNKKYKISGKIEWLLAILRFAAITAISFLLLSPLVKTIVRNVEKPVIIVAQDNSESIIIGKDSLFYKDTYPGKIKNLVEELEKEYLVKTMQFGESVSDTLSFTFKEKITDISSFFDDIQTRYTNRNVGALILTTDGLYNQGKNPLYASDFASFPIYTIALGDTNIYKDLLIKKVNYNNVAFLGNMFPVEIVVNANKCAGANSKLTVNKGTETVFSKTLTFDSESSSQSIFLEIEATLSGLQCYSISLAPVDDEITAVNNYTTFCVNVLDQKQKILILANSPSPDIAAIKKSLEDNQNYEVTFSLAENYAGSVKGYSLVILHQIPSITNTASVITDAIKVENIPVVYILGAQSNYTSFNALKTGLNVAANTKTSQNEALAVINNDFPLFSISNELKLFTDDLPPLSTAFGTYSTSSSSNILFYQKIGAVSTKQPLMMFNEINGYKTCIIAGEGIWKWKMFDYAKNQSHDIFNTLMSKIVQYIALTEDKSFFRITGADNFNENENIEFDAEVYNDSYELINDPEVSFIIYDSKGTKFPFTFSKTNNAYQLNAGMFPVGAYRYEAKVKVGEKIYTETGHFNVLALYIESLVTTADHKMLYNLTSKHDGKLFYPAQMDELLKSIKSREDIKSVAYSQKNMSDLMNIFWVFVFILFLLSLEWFIRKWSGNY